MKEAIVNDTDFHGLTPNPSAFAYNYEYDSNVIARRTLFVHNIKNLVEVRDKLNEQQQQPHLAKTADYNRITLNDIPNITYNDDAVNVTRTGNNILCQILQQNDTEEVTPNIMFRLIWQQYMKQIILIVFLFLLETVCKLVFSMLLKELFAAVTNIEAEDNMKKAYQIAVYCGVLWVIGQIGRHNGYYQAAIVVGRIRTQLLFMVYLKLSGISLFTANTQKIGKIINLLSSQFNSMQLNFPTLLAAMVAPIGLIGIIAILITRFGWPGILIAATIILIVPMQIMIGKLNSTIIKKANVHKDERVKICTEIIEGIKFIKLYSWELAFNDMVQALRRLEIRDYLKIALGKSVERSLGNITGNVAAFLCFIVMDVGNQGTGLTAAKIFATMELMVTLRLLLLFTVTSTSFIFELKVTFERFCSIFNIINKRMIKIDADLIEQLPTNLHQEKCRPNSNEFQKRSSDGVDEDDVKNGEIVLKNFSAFWNEKGPSALNHINLKVKRGTLIGVTGKIGSGKSTLLSALLSQTPYYSGSIKINGSLAYVEQEPVIFSKSIKQNILFGNRYDQNKYNKVLESSCLWPDLLNMPLKDETIVGERGTTLSGGQKTRIAFARALYSDADIYLLDDPISAVDAKVAKKLHEVILKMKSHKTVILVTHQISYLFGCDRVLIMEDGKILHDRDPISLKSELNKFQMAQKLLHEIQTNNPTQKQTTLFHKKQQQPQPQPTTTPSPQKQQDQKKDSPPKSQQKPQDESSKMSFSSFMGYLLYTKANYVIFPICILFYVFTELINTVYFRILSQFDQMKEVGQNTIIDTMGNFWMVLGLLQLGYFVFCFFKYFLLSVVVLNSNEEIHRDMIYNLVRSPSSYYDITSTGSLSSKFSNDLSIMDNTLCFALIDSIQGPIVITILLANVIEIDKFFLIPGIINIVLLIAFFLAYKNSIIAAKQLDLQSKTPIFNMVTQMLAGLIQIKVTGKRYELLREFAHNLNQSLRGNLCLWNLNRAFGVVLSYITIFMMWIGFVIGIAVVRPETAGLYGVSIVFLMQISDRLQLLLKQITNLENSTLSASRIFGLTQLELEKPLRTHEDYQNKIIKIFKENERQLQQQLKLKQIQQKIQPNSLSSRPGQTAIRVANFSMRYRPSLPLVLKNLNFEIKHREKVGIVGRTGAGKSSLIQALFRIYEPEFGSTYQINDIDALTMGLHSLRENISVIPQTPFLFKGTVKKNLDPFEIKSDEELWKALEDSNLKQTIEKLPGKLYTDMTQVSQVFSVGQKQLLCLTRALLRNSQYLILDEATSNVDMMTDFFIQNCIKNKFKDTTVITIAHRLNTIADYDKLIVMEKGSVAEIGSPYELLMRKGIFSEMVQQTGKNAERIKQVARQSFNKLRNL